MCFFSFFFFLFFRISFIKKHLFNDTNYYLTSKLTKKVGKKNKHTKIPAFGSNWYIVTKMTKRNEYASM